jgi:hypothetical protein
VHRLRSASDIGESGPKAGELGLIVAVKLATEWLACLPVEPHGIRYGTCAGGGNVQALVSAMRFTRARRAVRQVPACSE